MTKVGWYIIGTSTTLASNKSLVPTCRARLCTIGVGVGCVPDVVVEGIGRQTPQPLHGIRRFALRPAATELHPDPIPHPRIAYHRAHPRRACQCHTAAQGQAGAQGGDGGMSQISEGLSVPHSSATVRHCMKMISHCRMDGL